MIAPLPRIVVGVVVIAAFFALSPSYGGALSCHYEVMLYGPRVIDVAVFGTSRIARGFDSRQFSDAVAAARGRRPVVANLARGGYDWGQQYVLIRDLLHRAAVETIILEANFQASAAAPHPIENGLRLADIWNDELEVQDGALLSRLSDGLRRSFYWTLRSTRNAAETFARRLWGRNEAREGCDQAAAPVLFGASTSLSSESPAPAVASPRDLYYLARIARLAARQGSHILLAHFPERNEPPAAVAIVETAAKSVGLSVNEPPPALENLLDDRGFAGQRHVNAIGRGELTAWLANCYVAQ